MGHAIEEAALSRGHEIVCRIDKDNQEDFDSVSFKSADVPIVATAVCATVLIARIPAAFHHFAFISKFSFQISRLMACVLSVNPDLGQCPADQTGYQRRHRCLDKPLPAACRDVLEACDGSVHAVNLAAHGLHLLCHDRDGR